MSPAVIAFLSGVGAAALVAGVGLLFALDRRAPRPGRGQNTAASVWRLYR